MLIFNPSFNTYLTSLLYPYVLYKLKIKCTLSFLYSSNGTVVLLLVEKEDLNTCNPNPIYHRTQLQLAHPNEAWPRKPGAETLQVFPRTWNQHLWFSSKTFWFGFQRMSVLLDQVCQEEKQSWGVKRVVGAVFYGTGYSGRSRERSEASGLLSWCRCTWQCKASQEEIKDTVGPGCSAHFCSWVTLNALPTGWSNSGREHRGASGVSVASGFSYNQT